MSAYPVTGKGTLNRAVSIVTRLAGMQATREVGATELAAAVGLPRSTVHRILVMLHAQGWVEHSKHGGFAIGSELMRLAWILTSHNNLRQLVSPVIEEFSARIDETVRFMLYEPARRRLLTVVSVESSQPLRYRPTLNQWMPLTSGSSSLAIISFLAPEERADIMRSLAVDGLEDRVAAVRACGYAISHGFRVPDVVGVAAPVWNAVGAVTGSVSVGIPRGRFADDKAPAIARDAVNVASAITDLLGGAAGPDEA